MTSLHVETDDLTHRYNRHYLTQRCSRTFEMLASLAMQIRDITPKETFARAEHLRLGQLGRLGVLAILGFVS